MAELNFKININGVEKSINNFRDLRTSLKEAEFQALSLSAQFGESDSRVVELRKSIGLLKDVIGDAAAAQSNYNKGAGIFPAIASSVQGIASGFTAVQGAIGLVGIESKDLEKQLLRVQSALAFSQGLSGIIQSKDAFIALGGAIKGTTIFRYADIAATRIATATSIAFTGAVATTSRAFVVLKGAIASTGIGALIVAAGILIEKLIDWASNTDEVTKAQERLNDELDRQRDWFEFVNEEIDYRTQLALASAKKRGASEKELRKIEIDAENERMNALKNRVKAIDEQIAQEIKSGTYVNEVKKKLDKERQDAIRNIEKEESKNRIKNEEFLAKEAEDIRKEQTEKEEQNKKERIEEEKNAQEVINAAYRSSLSERTQELYDIELAFAEKKEKLLKAGITNFAVIEEERIRAIEEVNKKYNEKELQLENQRRDEKEKRESDAQKIQIEAYRSTLSDRERETLAAEDELEAKKGELIKAGNYNFEVLEEEHRLKLLEINKKYDDVDKERELEILTLSAETNEEKMNAELVALSSEFQTKYDLAVKNGEDLLLLKQLFAAKEAAILKKYAEEDKKTEDAKLEAKRQALQATSQLLEDLSNIVDAKSAEGKILALGQIAVDTALAISSLTRNSENNPTNAVTFGGSAALQFATGLIRILANMKKAKDLLSSADSKPSVSTANTSNTAVPNFSPLQPNLNPVAVTSLSQSTINALGNSAIRAYVVETDITTSQQRIAAIKQRARFG